MKLFPFVAALLLLLAILAFFQYASLEQEFGPASITASVLEVPKDALASVGIGVFLLAATFLGLGIAHYNKTIRN
ncbi:hypothetical protein J4453_00415 [Candidatus Woesearchaeota archaeon]|nr:hypothetical protein [Candidatus Woesearchaeota archaeon]